MSEFNKPCPVCRGGTRQLGTTTFTVDLGLGVVVVRDVPAQVCNLCGADWIEDTTAETLERIVEQAREKHTVVKAANWSDVVRALVS